MSNSTSIRVAALAGALVLALIGPAALGQAPQAAPAPGPAAATATAPSTQPAEPLVSVGDRKILQSDVEQALAQANVPAYQRDQAKDNLLTQLTLRLLQIQYTKAKPVDAEILRKEVERVQADLALRQWMREETTREKLDAYVAKYPQFFDGTRVRFSQILIECPVYASTGDQVAKLQETDQLRKRITSGQLSFEEAAGTSSAHASKSVGGDMGVIEFINPARSDIDLAIAIAVFSTPRGEVSNIIRSARGFHLFKVTEIQPGDGIAKSWQDPKSGQTFEPQALAAAAIGATIENEIMQAAVNAKDCQVTNHVK